MSGYGFGVFGRIAAFHGTGDSYEFVDEHLFLIFFQLVVAPVIYYGSAHHHHSAGPGQVASVSEVGAFECVEH